MLEGLRARREQAIDAGDTALLKELDSQIADLAARIEQSDQRAEKRAGRAERRADRGPNPNGTRNVIIAVVAVFAACGMCGVWGSSLEDPSPATRAAAADSSGASAVADTSTGPRRFTDRQREDFSTFYTAIVRASRPADAAGERMTAAANANDLVAMFRAAEDLERASREAGLAVDRVHVPTSLPDSLRDQLEEGVERYRDAYFQRAAAADGVVDALDSGNLTTGDLARFQERVEGYNAGVMLGAVNFVGVAFSLGVDIEELE